MAPTPDQQVTSLLQKRFCTRPFYSTINGCVYGSPWFWYGRWIFTAVLVGLFFIILFLWFCVSSRRRRRHGARPMYGTGWMAPNNGGQYYNNPQGYSGQAYQQPPPAYGAPGQSYPMDNQYRGTNNQYGQQASGVEAPKNVYSGDYAPPSGPPPNK
ncbi:chitin synthesis regulation, resistance to congo red-domain-containing protein [Xylaria nigripes]|nr:chitin synthesis regulation, resistance to congo red-domain-containing protein [Xylaria nigripes]